MKSLLRVDEPLSLEAHYSPSAHPTGAIPDLAMLAGRLPAGTVCP